MVTAADVARLRQANQGIVRLGVRDLNRFWATLDLGNPTATRDALIEFTPELTTAYGEISATVSADWYDEMRSKAGARPGYRAQIADVVERDVVVARTRFGAGHLFTDRPIGTLDFLATALSEYMLQPGADTITANTNRDPAAAGWHRETRPGACKFCRMLAGRGGVYKRSTANFAAHGDCHCVAVPSWDADAPEVGAAQYEASRRMDGLRSRAAAGSQTAQRQLEEHRQRVRDFVANMPNP